MTRHLIESWLPIAALGEDGVRAETHRHDDPTWGDIAAIVLVSLNRIQNSSTTDSRHLDT